MVQIQIDMPKHIDKKIGAFSALSGIHNKRGAIIAIIQRYFQQNPTLIEDLLTDKEEKKR